jgi:H+/Cl- antiporter ClcA
VPLTALKRIRHHWFSPQLWLRRLVLWGGAVCVGSAAILFAMGAEQANILLHRMIIFSPYLPLVITPAGLALAVYVTRRIFPGAEGSGIPQVIAALQTQDNKLRSSVLSLKVAAGKIIVTMFGLVVGAAIGREGPTVQIGASIMHALGRFVRFSRQETERGLILAGGAAGVAAAFNTPLAGIVFAIEEMSRSFEERTSGTILTAVIIAGITSLAVLGDYPYFGYTSAVLPLDIAWIAVIVCGAGGGLAGGIFSRMVIASARGLPGKAGMLQRNRPVLFAAACGLILAVLGLLSSSTTYGTGYHEARSVLEGNGQVPATYGILKLLATAVSYASGIPGGLFSPSLAVGAGFGVNISAIMPYAPAGAVVLLGMAGYFAGVVQAPITAFVIVIEMTDNHQLALPLMATALLASGTSRLICPSPIYKALSEGFLARSKGGKSGEASAKAQSAKASKPPVAAPGS